MKHKIIIIFNFQEKTFFSLFFEIRTEISILFSRNLKKKKLENKKKKLERKKRRNSEQNRATGNFSNFSSGEGFKLPPPFLAVKI